MYSVADYGRMLADEGRMGPYLAALRAVVKPGHVVVDIGTGTGIMALWACKLGARHVYAIDDNPAIDVARRIAKDSGFADRITFYEALSTDVTLPEKADVAVSDIRGNLPLLRGNFRANEDARARLLEPHGVLVPHEDTLFTALVSAAEGYSAIVGPYESTPFDMRAARDVVVNTIYAEGPKLSADALLTEAAPWATLAYGGAPPTTIAKNLALEVRRAGTAHAWSLWFDAKLYGDIGFSNAPGTSLVYGRAFLPLEHPIEVRPGERVDLALFARAAADGDWLFGWVTTHVAEGGARRTFRQATLSRIVRPSDEGRLLTPTPLAAAARRGLEHLLAGEATLSTAELARRLDEELRLGADAARDLARTLVQRFAKKS